MAGGGWGLGGCSRYRTYVFPLISTTFLFLKKLLTKTSEQHKKKTSCSCKLFRLFSTHFVSY